MPRIEGISQNKHNLCVLVNDVEAKHIFSDIVKHVYFPSQCRASDISCKKNVFIISSAQGLKDIAEFVRLANDSHSLRALLVKQDSYHNWITQFLVNANLRTLKNLVVYSGWEVPQRVLNAWKYGQQDRLIADAAVLNNCLFVLDCAMHGYEIPFKKLKVLSKIPASERHKFVISKEGARISWTKYDVDLDLESIQITLNPVKANEAQARKIIHNKHFGAAIAHIRKSKKIKQDQIKGLSDRQVRRIESGEHATLKSLGYLAAAHNMTLKAYLNKIANYIQQMNRSRDVQKKVR